MTHSSPVNATATAKCKHEELCFHSGGHYVYCPACRGWWVARADAHTSDERIDFNRAANSDVIGGEVRVRRTAVPAQQPPSPVNETTPFEDPDFVMSEEVQTEYERGVAEGQKRIRYLCDEAFRRALADELEIDALKARIEDLKGRSGVPAQSTPIDPLADLVDRFSTALLAKLRLAEANGRSGWDRDDWEQQCQQGLLRHIEKGDPRDVAAYCAFMWHHGWITALTSPEAQGPLIPAGKQARFKNEKHWFSVFDWHNNPENFEYRTVYALSSPESQS